MTLRELQEFDLNSSIYTADFSTIATLQDGTTIYMLQSENEEFGDIEHDIFKIKNSDASKLNEGDTITIESNDRVVLSIEQDNMSLGLECYLVLEEREDE